VPRGGYEDVVQVLTDAPLECEASAAVVDVCVGSVSNFISVWMHPSNACKHRQRIVGLGAYLAGKFGNRAIGIGQRVGRR